MAAGSGTGKSVTEWLIRVIELGCDGLEIEYRGGYEEITAMKGNFGFGIGQIKSSSRKAAALRDELWSLRNRTKRIEVRGTVYKARVRAFESFGETAYHIDIR
jgi:hypothetical protein